MLNNIETCHMKIKQPTLTKEIKIQTKLYKGSNLLGFGDFVISVTALQKRDESIKKWLNLNTTNGSPITNSTNRKLNFAMNLINSIRINLKAVLNYTEMKIQLNSNTDVIRSNNSHNINSNTNNPSNGLNTIRNSQNNFRNIIDNLKQDFTNAKKENENFIHKPIQNNNLNSPIMKKKLNTRNKNLSCSNINSFHNLETPVASKIKQKISSNINNLVSNNNKINNQINIPVKTSARTEIKNNKNNSSKQNTNKTEKKNSQSINEDTIRIIPTEVSTLNNKYNDSDQKQKENEDLRFVILMTENTIETNYYNNKNISEKKELKIETPKNVEIKLPIINNEETDPENRKDEDLSQISDHSFIDQIFSEDSNDNKDEFLLNKFSTCLNEFKSYYTDNLINILPDDSTYLKFEIKMLVEKGFEIQDNYNSELKELLIENRQFKSFLLLYNEKHRHVFKKLNRLKEQIESNRIKQTLNCFIKKQEIKTLKEHIETVKNELNLHKRILKLNFGKNEIKEFINQEKIDYEMDKNKLLKLTEKIFNNEEVKNKLTDVQKMILHRIFNKQKELDNKKKNENLDDKKLNEDIIVENLDSKILKILSKIQSKKNISSLQFKKLSEGIYEYEGTKLIVTLEKNDVIKVNNGNKIQNFEEFLDSTLSKPKTIKKEVSAKIKKHLRYNSMDNTKTNQSLDSSFFKNLQKQKKF